MNLFFEFIKNLVYIRLILAVIILLAFLFGRKLLSKLTIKLIAHIKISPERLEIDLYDRLKTPLDYLFIATGLYFSLSVSPFVYYPKLAESVISVFNNDHVVISVIGSQVLAQVYFGIVTLLLTWLLVTFEHIYEGFLYDTHFKLPLINNSLFIRFTSKLVRLSTIILGTLIGLYIMFPRMGMLLTGLGATSVVVAYIAKDPLNNILYGALLMVDQTFVINDWIECDGLEGIVEDISFRSTRIRTFTQGLVVVPNSNIGNANIINWTRMEKRRVKFDLGIAYGTPISKINSFMARVKALLAAHPSVENDSFIVAFENFGDYALNIQILYFSTATSYAPYIAVKEDINLQLLALCEEMEIDIAFPTQTIVTQQ